ncbi:TIGR01620 family protein [Pseudoalteromonas sp. OOF1S-7]|uniref:TIGR01620 family protein n=1 Tax=Pseudoalteromonas sp. OOF1S-7 TaxID=2917757 RepID=UPI001EF653A8|nr:TIGR01620 family protein [Pseudoalteromonas sp. OOF1S-7]MCG7537810.1 TIGR01620 family protein [Pseudoalteromonas sp. OOF1S-7]
MSEPTQSPHGRRVRVEAAPQAAQSTTEPEQQQARRVEQGTGRASISASDEREQTLDAQLQAIPMEPVVQPHRATLSWRKLLLLGLAVLIPVEMILTLLDALNRSWVLAGLYGLVIVSALVVLAKFCWSEVRALGRLKKLEQQRAGAQRLLSSNQIGEAQTWLKPLLKQHDKQQVSQFMATLQPHFTDREVLALYDKTLLQELDERARQLIAQFASTSALMVAISPMAITDMLAVLWRGVVLIEKISQLYGIKLGYRSRIELYRLLLKQIIFVGASELLSDLAATSLGAELLGKLSARSAQGLSAGVFTARLGYKAMSLCRPIPVSKPAAGYLSQTARKLANLLIRQSSGGSEEAVKK